MAGESEASAVTPQPALPLPPAYSIKITVPGEPVPKGRPRARIVSPRFKPAFIHFYQDADTEKYETLVAQEARLVMRGRGLLIGALRVEVTAWLTIPVSWSGKQKQKAADGLIMPVSRPDADNFLKCCLDAMNKVVYRDDAQVIDMRAAKRYSHQPRLEIEIFPA